MLIVPEIFSDMNSVWDLSETTVERLKNSSKVYVMYIKKCGPLTVLLYFLLTFGWQLVRILTEFWLSSIVSTFNLIPTQELQVDLACLLFKQIEKTLKLKYNLILISRMFAGICICIFCYQSFLYYCHFSRR